MSARRSIQTSPLEGSINFLPEELLLCIFKILVRYNPISVRRLLFVSRYWHHIVQRTPCLWSNILINPRNPSEFVRYNQYVTRALARCTRLPLDVTIDLDRLYHCLKASTEPNKVDTTTSFRDLFSHSGESIVRWRSFRLRIQPDHAFRVEPLFGLRIYEGTRLAKSPLGITRHKRRF
jgi:hypothetical protein